MSRKVVAANLLDMIELITSRKLQEEVFTRNAPDLNIKWDRLPRNVRRRAEILHARMEELAKAKKRSLREQHANIFRTLNTIALVNADSANTAEIEKRIKQAPELGTFFLDSFARYDLPEGARKTANLVAFINVVMLSEKGTPVGTDAQVIWDDLLASATAALDATKHDRFKLLPPQHGHNRTQGLVDFEDELRTTVSLKFSEKDYLVMAACETVETHVRYLVKTTPLDHDVSKVVRDKSGKRRFENRPDDNAEAFEIRYFEHHNRIEISRTRIISTLDIARMFASRVLGTRLDERKKRFYDEPLQIFQTRECLNKIKLPTENLEWHDMLWVQKLILVPVQANLTDESDSPRLIERKQVTFTGDDIRSVFNEIDAMLDPTKFPRSRRRILGATVVIRLHDVKNIGGKLLASTASKAYSIRISERHFTIEGRNKIHDQRLLAFFDQLQTDWGFEGLTPDAHKTSKGLVSVKGERKDELDGNDLFGDN